MNRLLKMRIGVFKMPCNYKQYHPDWKEISKRTIAEAGDRCTLCYAPNRELIFRQKGHEYPWQIAKNYGDGYDYPKMTKVVLTVHHIDSDKKNNSKLNLIALCQRCHLKLDMGKHVKNRMAKKDQTNLFDDCNSRLA